MTTETEARYTIVDCSFRSDGSGRLYGYKIPTDWTPKIGQPMRVETDNEKVKIVVIMKIGVPAVAGVPYKWGRELLPMMGAAVALPDTPKTEDSANLAAPEPESIAARFQPSADGPDLANVHQAESVAPKSKAKSTADAPREEPKSAGPSSSTDLAPVLDPTPAALAIAYGDREIFETFYAAVVKESKIDADVTTKEGREAITSMAYKIARVKTKVDDFGKALGDDARKTLEGVNTTRAEYKRKLQDLQDDVRKPLDTWEAETRARNERMADTVQKMRAYAVITADMTSTAINDRRGLLEAIKPTADDFGTRLEEATAIYDDALAAIDTGRAAALQREDDAKELAKLREERAKAESERVAAEARQAEEQRARDAEAARLERERAEAERLKALEEETRRRALQDAEDIAAAERLKAAQEAQAAQEARDAEEARIHREHAAAIQAERDRTAQAEAALAAERERVAQAKRVQDAADAARRADEEHRARIIGEASLDLANALADTVNTADVVQMIIDGQIRHVTITF